MRVVHIYLDGKETADTTDIVERWELVIGSVRYSLMSHLALTPDDARLHTISIFIDMGCKNGYNFGSMPPTRVWSDDF